MITLSFFSGRLSKMSLCECATHCHSYNSRQFAVPQRIFRQLFLTPGPYKISMPSRIIYLLNTCMKDIYSSSVQRVPLQTSTCWVKLKISKKKKAGGKNGKELKSPLPHTHTEHGYPCFSVLNLISATQKKSRHEHKNKCF